MNDAEPQLVTIDAAATAVVRDVVPVTALRDFFDTSFGALAEAISAQGLTVVGPAFGLYRGDPGDTLDIEVGFPTDRAVQPSGTVTVGSLPGGRVARLLHVGGFDGLTSSWDRLHSWILAQGLDASSQRWEVYVTQPSPEMDPADLRTELNWPVAESV
ncbi:effector-binding domain-containing protein [Nocardia tenerifensis]|uniref:Effector-binding domain-containing protein n=1 Tax=Nocardia tenerifensis TaxID=228006 RepID=A0A318KHT0_9NOCA|nr:GyrI-like domain-containing protein [Nocardia tenerifensis]PXX71723.1 effector-binding domain-containing protein [Nocardia tenerifensis]